MQSNKIWALISIVLVVAIGFVIYKFRPVSTNQVVDVNSTSQITPSPVSATENKSASAPIQTSSPLDKNLTADEKSLLYTPLKAPTKEEEKARYDLANKLAVAGNKIVINNCVAKPTILKTKLGSSITVSNEGTQNINFGFSNKDKVLVAAGKSVTYKVNFSTGQGIYGYGCDNKDLVRAIGLLFVTP